MRVRARLAPSPTGLLHVGHARSFLLAWLSARSRDGEVLLRLEDLDRGRVREEFRDACLEDLTWLGLDWDGPPSFQSDREKELRETAEGLVSEGLAYPCICTRREIRAAISAPHVQDATSTYPGTCKGRFSSIREAQEISGRRPALRFQCTPEELEIQDRLHGAVKLSPWTEFGDFVIASPEGHASYQLAVVLDDAEQGITEVLRGDDLLSSCGPQALLQGALGLRRPDWIHVPLVVDSKGERLSKRADSLSIRAIREAGVAPERLLGWLLSESGLSKEGKITAQAAIAGFQLEALNRAPIMLPKDFLGSLA